MRMPPSCPRPTATAAAATTPAPSPDPRTTPEPGPATPAPAAVHHPSHPPSATPNPVRAVDAIHTTTTTGNPTAAVAEQTAHATMPWWLGFPPVPKPLLPHVPAALLPYSWLGLAIAFALVLNGVFLCYLTTLVTVLIRHKRQPEGDASRFGWHFLIPCRDEEAVIGGTIGYLTSHFPQAHVWVIDDDSDDATAQIVAMHQNDPKNHKIHLVARRRPDARTGKSEALNAAYRQLSETVHKDRDKQIVAVIDADGRLAPGSLDVVAADHLFGDPGTGAVQIEVRMVNRHEREPLPGKGRAKNLLGRVLIRLQDIEFRTVCSAAQISRRYVRTVAMGGNGQFMRLTVLDEIGGAACKPWRGSLQEDFEIGLHVLLAGQRTEYTPDTYVDQEALPDPGRLVVQRTRWSQGMMQCIRYLPELWRSRYLGTAGVLELSYCLIQPWVQLLATVLYPLPWLALCVTYLRHPADAARFGAEGGWTLLVLYLLCALTQLAVWGLVYWRVCERDLGPGRALGFGIAFSMLVYVSYLATWRALFRIVRRRKGWSKTRRNAEFTGLTVPELACDVPSA